MQSYKYVIFLTQETLKNILYHFWKPFVLFLVLKTGITIASRYKVEGMWIDVVYRDSLS